MDDRGACRAGALSAKRSTSGSELASTLIVAATVFSYAVAWVIGLFLVNGYAFEIPSSRAQSAIAVIKATPFAGLAGVLAFFFDPYVMTRPLIVVSTLIGAAFLIAMRVTVARLLLHESLAVRAVLLSSCSSTR